MAIMTAHPRTGRTRRTLRRGVLVAAVGVLLASVVSSFQAAQAVPTTTAPFNECPAIGADTSCGILIIINPGGSLTVKGDSTQGPYDSSEDSLIGVLNNSGQKVDSIALTTNTDAFGFDGDGLCTYTFTGSSGCPFDTTGYGGPNTSFSNISPDSSSGTVNFTGGLGSGATAFFSLEEALTEQSFNPNDQPATGPCTKTYTGKVSSAILVSSNSTTCIVNATVVSGATISVPAGAELVVTDSTVAGSIVATNPHAMTICNSKFGGSINVSGSTAFVLIGDGGDGSSNSPCLGNTIKGSVTLTKATGGIELGGNTITGSTTITSNVAPNGGTPTEDAATEVEGNTIGGALLCLNNTPAPTYDGATGTVSGQRVGQCKLLG